MTDADRVSIPTKFWSGGVNSFLHPSDLNPNEFAWAENTLNRGGIVQTRPGFNLASSILGNKLQGFTTFTPINGATRLVVAVDGSIYVGTWPNFVFDLIEQVSFDPTAPIINFCECLQSVKRHIDGSLEVISPVKVLMIADGINPTVVYNGVTTTQMDPAAPNYQTPIGLWMVWVSSRLWISVGTQMRVSDTGNPTSFEEDQFLATQSYFGLPDVITGVIETANERGLLVFTERTTTVFQSYIRDKNSWGATPDFQKLVFPNIGCDAGRTACNQYGLTYWHSLNGLVSLDAAMNTQHSSKLQSIDGQMMRSKRLLSPDMSGACAIAYDNFLLVSVPSGGKYNEQTWVLDQTPMGNLLGVIGDTYSKTTWSGVWTGVRPVQWAQGRIGGRKRLYFASYDRTPANNTRIHIWEAMRQERKDAGGRIRCQFQQGIAAADSLQAFKYAEFEVVELLGAVSLKVYVCGTRGPWFEVGSYELRAEEGSIGSKGQTILTNSSILRAYKPQSRRLRTREFTSQGLPNSPENTNNRPGHDKGFALLFEWSGRMGIHDIKLNYGPASESNRGFPSHDESGKINVVLENGEVITP